MVKTRFAPSPTGYLHIGGARTALFNYLFSKHHNGVFVLRIEDTDMERSKDEYTRDILEGLKWLGIIWDEGPFFQRERMEIYREHAYRLIEKGLAYRCYCTPEELEEKRNQAIKEGKKATYDRTCRELKEPVAGKPYAIRFKTPITGQITFNDLIRGKITFNCEELDDLIILRSDGTPTYNFTVVVDDALMGITHIIRGDDHINNTPRQILIYEALGYKAPNFAHVPLIHGKDRTRLSKRHGATSLLEYKNEGFLPEALMNYLARLGWAYGDQEIFSKEELIEKFDLDHVGKSPAIFDMDKLKWLNSHYIKTSDDNRIAVILEEFLTKLNIKIDKKEKLIPIVKSLKDRAKTIKEMAQMAEFFFNDEIHYEEKAKEKFLTPDTRKILESFLEGFTHIKADDEQAQKALIEGIVKTTGKKPVDVIQPIRVSLCGRTASPGIFEVINILGKESVENRLKRAIDSIK
ncbi:MAG TPA: glutamate--tRNA ligase [Syntrophorhabdaceae bacterium]|nr:glutamate--tRNA ligase [Syntrophorhabdaceae bacterium]HPU30711.1 glutamate--tRNA ligase [Syntrophorhabdaceae bacterium]